MSGEVFKAGDVELRLGEEWLPVSGFPGYEVSSLGRVRSWRRDGTATDLRDEPRVLSGWRQQGYPFVNLSLGPKAHKRAVHRLVAVAFLGPCAHSAQASHLNGNRADCRAVNLVWESARDNNSRKREHGTWQSGERHGCARLSAADAETIRLSPRGYGTGRAIARRFGISESQVSAIRNGKSWANG